MVFGDLNLDVKGDDFHYMFSYCTGGLESLVICGKEWLYRSPRPTFWRATTDNDRGSGFHLKSGMWLAADMFITCAGVKVLVNGYILIISRLLLRLISTLQYMESIKGRIKI